MWGGGHVCGSEKAMLSGQKRHLLHHLEKEVRAGVQEGQERRTPREREGSGEPERAGRESLGSN